MTGDYTKVPLRQHERWESAPAQEGRALLDHELNLDAAASIRRDRMLSRDAIGPAGVVEGSAAFAVSVVPGPTLALSVDAGRMWVDGLAALAPEPFTYSSQDQIADLPATGRALLFLDVWEEHIQPAEDPTIVDPALAPVDTAARTRVGYRVRAVPTNATTCEGAWNGFNPAPLSTGRLTALRVGPAQPSDPCDPPGDAQGLMPDGLLRIEVLDQGSAAGARFAWSYENGSASVPIAEISGNTVTLQPSSSIQFGMDQVEISWLARRADRQNAGGLYTITDIASLATGDVLTLDRPVTAPPDAEGLVVRRWDGQVIGAVGPQNAARGGNDLGVRFQVGPGTYRPGDWWGVRARQADGIEPLTAALPDGSSHSFAPLALVDIDAGTVLSDCRPTFRPLTDIETGSPCTVVVRPGDNLQAAVDSLPDAGGEVCLSAGLFPISAPVLVANRNRVRIVGVGPATIVATATNETVFRFVDSDEVELLDMSLRAAAAGVAPGNPALNGAVNFEGCRGVEARSLHISVPDGALRTQTAITVRPTGNRRPDRVSISGNRLVVGAWQTGVLVTDGRDVTLDDNHVSLGEAPEVFEVASGQSVFADELTHIFTASIGRQGRVRAVVLPTGETVALLAQSPVGPLVDEWVRIGAPRTGTPREGFRSFLQTIARKAGEELSPDGRSTYARLARDLRSVGQGIALGGRRIETVRVSNNIIRDAVQGIHIGASRGATNGVITEALIVGNTMHLRVPTTYARERHAIFVGNVRSLEIAQTRSTLARTLGAAGLPRTPVDGIRLIGSFGPSIVVRGASFSAHDVGVRARPFGATPTQRVWSLRDVIASGLTGAIGAEAPTSFNRDQVAP
ncbi:MAG: DUF6519 domain-containing protein [Acidimicrobiales bacterium]